MNPPKLDPRVAAWKRPLLRAAGSFLLATAIVFLWWALDRFTSALRVSSDLNQQSRRLALEIEEMQSRWSPDRIAALESQGERNRRLVFDNEADLSIWLSRLQEEAIPLALDVKPQVGAPTAHPDWPTNLLSIPLSIEIRPAAEIESLRSPYERLLGLCRFLESQDRRVDWIEFQVTGDTNSVTRSIASLRVWAQEGGSP